MDAMPTFFKELLLENYSKDMMEMIERGLLCKRKTTLRVNTIKTDASHIKKELLNAGIEYREVNWNKDALVIVGDKKSEIEKLDIYINGEIYLQSLSSMLPPIILAPEKHTDILDMCAAPGGKTTELAALSENEANITACELKIPRIERLKYNIEKQGASSVYIMKKDARYIDDFFSFDAILLDAPCSGSGTLNLNVSNLEKFFNIGLINKSIVSQTALLKKALKILKPGKEMVYSTCSILKCENEDILDRVLLEENAEIVPIEQIEKYDLPLLPVNISGTICIAPTELYEGFFVAKIRKNK